MVLLHKDEVKALNCIEYYMHTYYIEFNLCSEGYKTQRIFSTRLSTRADIYNGKISCQCFVQEKI